MEGIIYKVQPYLESSKLLFTYTPQGKITLIAKGSQKMTSESRVLSQYFNLISFDYEKKQMFSLKTGRLINGFDDIKKDILLFKEVAYVLELLDKVVSENEKHDILFKYLIQSLTLGNIKENLIRFSMHMLHYLGYDLPFEADGREVKGFNISKASLVYKNESYTIDLDVLHVIWLLKLKHTTYETITQLPEDIFQKIKTFLKAFIRYHVNITIIN